MKTRCLPFEWWVARIESGVPFTFVRYGDGELNGMFWVGRGAGGGRTKNGDGHTLRNKGLRRALRRSVTRPGVDAEYYRTLWMTDTCIPHERLARDHLDRLAPDVTWYNALAIQDKLNAGRGFPFIQTIRNRKMPLVLVGPDHLGSLPKAGVFDLDGHAVVPYGRAFFSRERIVNDASELIRALGGRCLVTVHAGPSSPVFAWDLWCRFGETCMILDLGSIFDGFVSARFGGPVGGSKPITRKHWKKRCTQEIVDRNLGRN